MLKKIAIGLAVLVVLLVAVGSYLFSNLDSIIQQTVEKYGSAATQTTVKLDGVHLSLTDGKGTLSGLSVGNPSGYSSAKALSLGKVAVNIDTKSIAGTGPIIINSIDIEKPQVSYEMTGESDGNLQTIMHNVQNYAGMSPKAQKEQAKATPAPSKPGAQSAPSRKLIITSLTINGGYVSITTPLLQGRALGSDLPTIHLSNIGKDEGGASPGEVARLLIGAISDEASRAAAMDLTREFGNLKGIPGNIINNAPGAGSIGGSLKSLIGQ